MVHIGSAWTQNPPLIADYIEPESIGKAVSVQGLITALATIFSIGVLYDETKGLDFKWQITVACVFMYILAILSVIGLKEVVETDPEQDEQELVVKEAPPTP